MFDGDNSTDISDERPECHRTSPHLRVCGWSWLVGVRQAVITEKGVHVSLFVRQDVRTSERAVQRSYYYQEMMIGMG